jgi:Bacteriophage abortive infection AbiH
MLNLNIDATHLVILGNGFDLNQKRKTEYSSYLNSQFFLDIKKSDNSFLKIFEQQTQGKWIDLEMSLKGIGKHFTKDRCQSDFHCLSSTLKQYLSSVESDELHLDEDSYKLIKSLVTEDFIIMDFNYTNTTKLILTDLRVNETEIEKRLIKVHGSLSEDYIIIGVEDNANIMPENVFLKKSSNKHFRAINLLDQTEKIKEIYFFGHSLGITDNMYFEDFFDDLCHQPSLIGKKRILLYYYDEDSRIKLICEIDRLTNNRLSKLRRFHYFEEIEIKKTV